MILSSLHCTYTGSRLDRSWFTIKQDNPPLTELLLLTVVSMFVCLSVSLYFTLMSVVFYYVNAIG